MNEKLKSMIEQTDIEKVFKDKGYAFFTKGAYNLNIFSVRSLLTGYDKEKQTLIQSDTFDDCICLMYKEVECDGPWIKKIFPCSTDPGLKYLVNPMSSVATLGTAILVPGQYRGCYKVDYHNGSSSKQLALCQRLGPVRVWRDNTKDNIINLFGPEYEGMFSINIHSAGENSIQVGSWSAGCTVIQTKKLHEQFMNIVKKSESIYGNKFTYTLLNSTDLEGY